MSGAVPSASHQGGIDRARALYTDHVAAKLDGLAHAAALLGEGSEVLGFDDATSADHDFRTRVQLFVESDADVAAVTAATRDAAGDVEVAHVRGFFEERLGFDPADGVTLADWLTTPSQRSATLTQGEVFHDPHGILTARRESIAWYPDDVWRYVLAAAWLRVSQHEHFLGRIGGRGDEVGSALVGARLVRDTIRLAFLIERTWAPYDKWLSEAFGTLNLATTLRPKLATVLTAVDWRDRERALGEALTIAAQAANDLGLAEPVDTATRQFHSRDIRVLGADRLTAALTVAISDPELVALLGRLGNRHAALGHGLVGRLPGAVDQVTDNVDVLTSVERCRSLAPLLMGE